MAHVILDWNQEKVDKVIKLVDNYITRNDAYNGEKVAQSDKCIENSINLVCNLADLFEDDEYWNND